MVRGLLREGAWAGGWLVRGLLGGLGVGEWVAWRRGEWFVESLRWLCRKADEVGWKALGGCGLLGVGQRGSESC